MQKIFFSVIIILLLSSSASAHSGRTDSQGGHYNRKTGIYHYHNGGSSSRVSSTSSPKISIDSEVKSVQDKLNSLGFNCGVADGVMGNKTKQALKDFQTSKSLVVDGNINIATKKALGL